MKKFHSEDAWLINPDRPGRSRKKRKVDMARRKRSRKSAKRSHRRRKAAVVVVKTNPSRRRRAKRNAPKHRRRYRRNPSLGGLIPSKASLFDAVYVTGGFIATKIAANAVLPMIGVQQPIVRVGVKAVLAGALGWAGKRFLGGSAGQFLLIGGLVEAVNDAVQTYVSPYVPALSVSSYPQLSSYVDMSAYPDLSGMVSPEMDEQV
jgi:hypothetical protein